MTNKLIVRMSKNNFLKDKSYTITVNNSEQTYVLNTKTNRIEIDLNDQVNNIEISSKNVSKSLKVNNLDKAVKFLNISPKWSFSNNLGLGFLLGLTIIYIVFGIYILLSSIKFNLLFFPLFILPFLLNKNSFRDDFKIEELGIN